MFAALFVAAAAALSLAPPLPWGEGEEGNPLRWPALTGDAAYLQRPLPQHARNWRRYATLVMTPVTPQNAFGEELLNDFRDALAREAVVLPEPVLDEDGDLAEPILAAGPATDLLDAAQLDALAVALRDAVVYAVDLPFERQRDGFLKHRRPDLHGGGTEWAGKLDDYNDFVFGEASDSASMEEGELWSVVRRYFEHRRAAYLGGFNVVGVALDGPDAIVAGVYEEVPGGYGDGRLQYHLAARDGEPRGFGGYWFGSLLACGLRVTWPNVTEAGVLDRDDRLLAAEVMIVLETANGDRAPLSVSLFHDPATGRWHVTSACFTSSPFIAAVGWLR